MKLPLEDTRPPDWPQNRPAGRVTSRQRRRRRLYGLSLVAMLLAAVLSCGEAPPKGILSRQQMVKAMSEIYLAEEKTSRLGIKRDSALEVFDSLTLRIFRDMDTPDSAFQRSFNYYWQRPEEMEQIYAMLIDSLNLREQKLSLPGKDDLPEKKEKE